MPDGNIELLARIDHQVKIRGFRIELGEIESVLKLHPSVRESVVVAREDTPGDKRLVAYMTPTGSPPTSAIELQGFLKQKLPTYMVPSAFVFLDAFPLTPNGKLDRKALPRPDWKPADSDESYVAPRTPTEGALATIWSDVLGVEKAGVHDNFFDLGGHSLMIVRLMARINRTFKISLGVPELFNNPTLEQMARLIVGQQPMGKLRPAVVQLKEGNAKLPVYFIYHDIYECRLAQCMDEGRPVFGIEIPLPLAWRNAVADNRTSEFPSMEQLVAPFVAALSAHTGASPCVLAGHSFGGMMAFEAAHQFQKQGGEVEIVLLFDTWAKFPASYRIAWKKWQQVWKQAPNGASTGRLSQLIGYRLRSSWRVIRWFLATQKRKVWIFFNLGVVETGGLTMRIDEQGVPLQWELLARLYADIHQRYRPRRLDSRGILFQAAEGQGAQAVDASQGWGNLFSEGLEIILVPGDHLSMVGEHNLTLAREINEMLMRHRENQR